MKKKKITSFTDLDSWKKGHNLVLTIYSITATFPQEELFGLTSQLRRAAVSYTSNIAEGFSRRTRKEKMRFYTMALGSLAEIQNQILIARDLDYIKKKEFKNIAEQTIVLSKLTNGLIKSSKSKP